MDLAIPTTLVVMNRKEFTNLAKRKYSFIQEILKEGLQLHGDILNIVRS